MHSTSTTLSPLEAVAQHDVTSLLHYIDNSKTSINDIQLLQTNDDTHYPLLHYSIHHNSYRCVQELVRKGCSIYLPAGVQYNNDTPLHTVCRPYTPFVPNSSGITSSKGQGLGMMYQTNLPILVFLLSMISLDDYYVQNDKGQIPLHIAASTGNVTALAALYHHYVQKYEKSMHTMYSSSTILSSSRTTPVPTPTIEGSNSKNTLLSLNSGLINSSSVSSIGSEPMNASPDTSEEEGSTGGTWTPHIPKPSTTTTTNSSASASSVSLIPPLSDSDTPPLLSSLSSKVMVPTAPLNPTVPSSAKSYSISSFINYKDATGRTPLMLAILNNHPIAVSWLIRHGAYIEDKDIYQTSPLHYAINKGNVRTVDLLLEAIMVPSITTVVSSSSSHSSVNVNNLDPQAVPYRILFKCYDNRGRTPVQAAYQTLQEQKGLQSVSSSRKIYYSIRYQMAKYQIYYRMERIWNRSFSFSSSSTSSSSPSSLMVNKNQYTLPTSFLSTTVLLLRAASYIPYESFVSATLGFYLHLDTNFASYIWPVYSTWIWWIATAHVGPALLFVADDDTIGNIPGLSFSAWSATASAWLHCIAFCFLLFSSLGSLAYMRTHHLRKYDQIIRNAVAPFRVCENNFNPQNPDKSTFSVWKDSGIPHDTESQQLRKNFQQGLEIGIDQGVTKAGYCVTCEIVRLPRSKHCPYCNTCIRSFDHCCNWVNGDIGENNHGSFLLFVLTASLTSLAWLFMLAMYVRYVPAGYTVTKLRELAISASVVSRSNLDTIEVDLEPELGVPKLYPYHFGLWAHIKEAPVWMIIALQPVWMFAFGLIILWHQYRVISHGLTTNELLNRSHYSYLTDPHTGRYKNPYNEGNSIKNCSSFWKRSWPFPSVEEIQNHSYYRWFFGMDTKSLDSPLPMPNEDNEAFPSSVIPNTNPTGSSNSSSSCNGVRSRNNPNKIFSPSSANTNNDDDTMGNVFSLSGNHGSVTDTISGSSGGGGNSSDILPVSHLRHNNSSSTTGGGTGERKTNYFGFLSSVIGYVSGYIRTGSHYVRKTGGEIKQALRPL